MQYLTSLFIRQSAETSQTQNVAKQQKKQLTIIKKFFQGVIINANIDQDNDWLMNSIAQKEEPLTQPKPKSQDFRILNAFKDNISLSILIYNTPKNTQRDSSWRISFLKDTNFIILAIQPESFSLQNFRQTVSEVFSIYNNFLLIVCIKKSKENAKINQELIFMKQELKQEAKFLQIEAYNPNSIFQLKNFIFYYFYKKSQYLGMTFYNPKYSLTFQDKIQKLYLSKVQQKKFQFYYQAMKIYKERLLQLGEDPLMILLGNKVLQNLVQQQKIDQKDQKIKQIEKIKQQDINTQKKQALQKSHTKQQPQLDFSQIIQQPKIINFLWEQPAKSQINDRESTSKPFKTEAYINRQSKEGQQNRCSNENYENDSFIDIINQKCPIQISQEEYQLLVNDSNDENIQSGVSIKSGSGLSFSKIWIQKIKKNKNRQKK